MGLKEIGWESVDQWRSDVNMVMNLRKGEEFLD